MAILWGNAGTLPSRQYICAYCGSPLASNQVAGNIVLLP